MCGVCEREGGSLVENDGHGPFALCLTRQLNNRQRGLIVIKTGRNRRKMVNDQIVIKNWPSRGRNRLFLVKLWASRSRKG